MNGLMFSIGFIVSLVLLAFLVRVRNLKTARFMIIATVFAAFWLLMELLTCYIQISDVAIFFQKAKFVSVISIPPLYVCAANDYTNRKASQLLYGILLIIPVLSFMSLLTNSFPYPFLADAKLIYQNALPVWSYTGQLGFIVHTFYSYGLCLYACVILMIWMLRSPRIYRQQSIFVFAATLLTFAANITAITLMSQTDYTPLLILATLVILYFGIFHMPISAVIPMARERLVESIKDMAVITDSYDKIIDINPAAINFLIKNKAIKATMREKNFSGLPFHELLKLIPDIKTIRPPSESSQEGTLVVTINGRVFYLIMYRSTLFDSAGADIGRLYMLHDITEMQEYLNELKMLNDALIVSDRIIESAMEGILITDANGTITRVNRAFEVMTGYKERELVGENPRIMKSDHHDREFFSDMWERIINDGYWEGEIWDKKRNGEVYPKWMSITTLKNGEGEIENYIAVSTDISKIKKAEADIHSLAYYDALTGIPNRTQFHERLGRAIVRAKDNAKMAALLFMDLDGFKVINDSLGHAAGDLLLKEVATRIKACIRESDTVCRFGGDEFTVILENVSELDYVTNIAEGIIASITQPYEILDREITLGVSIGISLTPNDAKSVESLLRKADAAMYDAKETGKGRFSFSSDEIERRNHEVLEMQIKLNKALANDEFKLFLQPQVSFSNGAYNITGAEALIRWQTTDGAFYTPDRFIPVSESNGMIIPIGNWVLEEIFRIDRVLKQNGIRIKLAINVSSKQLEGHSFVAKVRETLEKYKEQHIHLLFEITESFLLKDLDKAMESLLEITGLGINIALDDFGTGFSSLNYLTRLPLNYLKIDKSFIDDIADSTRKSLTPHIISMAKTLGLKTVAEGVETKEQVDILLAEKCDELQGYYFSRPIDIDAFVAFAQYFHSDAYSLDEYALNNL